METFQIILFVIAGIVFFGFLVCVVYFNVLDKEGNKPRKEGVKILLAILIVLAILLLFGLCGGHSMDGVGIRHT